ncbi:MAG TPA: 2-dehydro-3-deoxygalactonokinase [Acetobacteraceae bacterium]|nr:2-dehydro-3-deoxygalactonokinase [Acetobacteraceae bacterium]
MIGVEWGQYSFRAFRLRDGAIRDRRFSARGVARVQDRRFGDALREEVGPWLAGGEGAVLVAGAVADPGGWAEAGSVACPAGAAEIAAGLTPVGFDWAEVRALPRLTCTGTDGAVELSAGEEAGFAAALALLGAEGGIACLPGARSRWVRIAQHRIAEFETHLSGELFAALRPALPPTRAAREPAITDEAGFAAGLAQAAKPGGLLRHLAALRTATAGEEAVASWLFGLLVGHEARAALRAQPGAALVHVIGPPDLARLYVRAIETAGGMAEALDGEATARGFALIGAAAGLA